MAENDPTTPPSEFAGRAAAAKGVADDMTAIFGTGSRGATPATGTPAAPRRHRPRVAIALLAIGGLTAIVGAGVMAGGSAVGDPTVPAATTAATRAATTTAAGATAAGATPVRRTAAPGASTIAVAGPEGQAAAPFSASTVEAPSAAFVARRSVARPDATLPVPVPPVTSQAPSSPSEQVACDSDDACLTAQVEAAERDIADAYADATRAGVRARTLRGYRDEWLRTRREVDRRPYEALRRYAMMTSDLHNLGGDAAAERTSDWR